MKKTTSKSAPNGSNRRENEIDLLRRELEIQRQIAYAAGLFQGDITIRTLLESLAEGVVIIDQSGIIVLVNNQTEKIFGYERDEMLGTPLNKLIPDAYHEAHIGHIREFFGSPRIRAMGTGRSLKALHKNGREFPVEISLSHLETSGSHFAMAFVTNITLRKEAETNLKSRNEDLDAFAHTVAHDLQGSLTPLIGYCELLTDTGVSLQDRQIKEYLQNICRISQTMSRVIDELLLLSSVRKEDVAITPLMMRPIIEEATRRVQEVYPDATPDIILAEGFPESLGYAPWIEHVWYNFISNAVKYGGEPPCFEIGGEVQGDGFARFWIRDSGTGIDARDLPHLFTPYVQRSNRSDSNGLGLSIVKRIVEKLNGHVAVESVPGKGSIFSFTLPIV